MTISEELQRWRAERREELIGRRLAATPEQRREWSERITRQLLDAFPLLRGGVVGFCWPYRGEFDPRFAIRRLRESGARAALPRVVARGAPLQFQAWWPGAPLRRGVLGIPVPDGTEPLQPQALLVPPVGFDARGYRLGYGAGYFDRTLAAAVPRPLAIAVGFELSRMPTIHPQPHDVPMDFVVTEAGVHRVGADGLARLDDPGEALRLAEDLLRGRAEAARREAQGASPPHGGGASPAARATPGSDGHA
jgi:5,10-methenyltetrahydrofolate synthetase